MKKEGKTVKFEGNTYYNARDTCRLLGISYPLLRRFVLNGEVPYIYFGRRKYFNLEELSSLSVSRFVIKKDVETKGVES